jgi:hypothetical protein
VHKVACRALRAAHEQQQQQAAAAAAAAAQTAEGVAQRVSSLSLAS